LDGVKLIPNDRSTFAARIQDGGIDGLIKALSDKNRRSTDSGPKPDRTDRANPVESKTTATCANQWITCRSVTLPVRQA
jgi:hypothetical protein